MHLVRHALHCGGRAGFARRLSSSAASSSSGGTIAFTPSLEMRLSSMLRRHTQLGETLGSSSVTPQEMTRLGKEYAELGRVVELYTERQRMVKDMRSLDALLHDSRQGSTEDDELAALAADEKETLQQSLQHAEADIIRILTPRDASDDRGIVLEVRAGTGGDEASLFASELFKMYRLYCLHRGWRWEEMSLSKTEIGGFKEAQASVQGEHVYKFLKFESGVHRVQRIPGNDIKIQTSAASVVILPEASEVDVEGLLRPQDLRIDVFRAGGAGGQSVNRTESAVRITHLPTGLVISMQDERSQIQNRARAMKYLRAKVYNLHLQRMQAERSQMRELTQSTGERSDKIRTYNFPQDRVTDHRIGLTINGVERVLEGGEVFDRVVMGLAEQEEKDRLQAFLTSLLQGGGK